jgi:hypothetical protein
VLVANQAASESRIAERRTRVAEGYLRGRSMRDLAQELDVALGTISSDMKAIREDWKERASSNFNAHVDEALAKIDRLELEYWSAWDRSVGKVTTERETLKGDDIEISTTTENKAGDPRFLDGVAWCIERRCRLLGTDAPKRIDALIQGQTTVKVLAGGIVMERV